jgi:tRNA/rRNA methyltransferase
MNKTQTHPVIILFKPQMGENIGAAARAMLNFGCDDLRIVAPRDGWPNEKAIEMARDAGIVIQNARVFETLEEASADLHHLYATTARRRDIPIQTFEPHALLPAQQEEWKAQIASNHEPSNEEYNASFAETHRIGFLFGPENSGLANAQIALCKAIVTIPVSERYTSINLAQSVGIILYSWQTARAIEAEKTNTSLEQKDTLNTAHPPPYSPASNGDIDHLFKHLAGLLDEAGYFSAPDKRPGMLTNLSAMLHRIGLCDQEVRTLRGMLRAISHKR